jgi:hypothetical protein
MRIHRNKLEPKYCGVTFLLNYLEVVGIQEGPIFQKMRKAEVQETQKILARTYYMYTIHIT